MSFSSVENGDVETSRWVTSLITVGDIVCGTVVASESYGAYVEHDDVKFFVPMHELSWRRTVHSLEVVNVGDYCEIIVDRTDNSPDGQPLASVRRARPELNPWADPSIFSVGSTFTGPVISKTDYGWFVVLANGILGLLHSDNIPPESTVAIGDQLTVEITICDISIQRLDVKLTQRMRE